MSDWESRYRQIKEQVLRDGQRAFLVEGSNDTTAYDLLFSKQLDRTTPNWREKWKIAHAGKKSNVLDMLRQEPTWLGLVDKDEWPDDEIFEKQQELPNRLVLPRFCMENYLVVPDEIWSIFPDYIKNEHPDGLICLQERLLHDLDTWVRHGVLWSVINPLWYEIRAKGFNNVLLQVSSVPDDAAIQAKLQEWHRFLEPAPLFQTFKSRLTLINALSPDEKLRKWVHGKKFWPEVVVPALNQLTGEQKSESEHRNNLWRTMNVPADWQSIWTRL